MRTTRRSPTRFPRAIPRLGHYRFEIGVQRRVENTKVIGRSQPQRTVTLRINRGEANDVPGRWEDYEVPLEDGMVVLDAVLYVQSHLANDLAVRWNCKAAKCGSCSAEVSGRPKLMCRTRLEELDCSEPIRVQPLQTFRRIRDLVTDLSWNYRVNASIPPFKPRTDREWRFYQRDVDRSQEMRKCIEWSSPGLADTQLSLSKMGGGVFSAKIETKSWQATGVHA